MPQASAANSAQSPPAVPKQPQKDDALGWQAEGDEGNTEANNRDSAHGSPSAQESLGQIKRIATLQARAALLGHSLLPGTDDQGNPTFIASRWGVSRQLSTLADVEAFLLRVGGRMGAEDEAPE